MLRRQFDAWLKQLLTFCDLDTNQFKGHSFRIGAASAAALRGDSDAKIRAAGRWSSDAFKKYNYKIGLDYHGIPSTVILLELNIGGDVT